MTLSAPISIKPLEWEKTVDKHRGSFKREQWAAETPFGAYFIWNYADSMKDKHKEGLSFHTTAGIGGDLGHYHSLNAAQYVVWKDYAERIGKCLVSPEGGV